MLQYFPRQKHLINKQFKILYNNQYLSEYLMINQAQNIQECSSYYVIASLNQFTTKRQPIRMCTKLFQKNGGSSSDSAGEDIVLQLYVYTQNDVYFSLVSANQLNKELNWGNKFAQVLKESLNGKNKNIVIQFNIQNLTFKFSSQFNQNAIRILLFQTGLTNLHQNPLRHAQKLCRNISYNSESLINKLYLINQNYANQIQKIDLLTQEVNQQCQFQFSLIKQKFLSLINQVKKKLRPHFGIDCFKKEEDYNSESQSRILYHIKLNRNSCINRQSENIQNLFE